MLVIRAALFVKAETYTDRREDKYIIAHPFNKIQLSNGKEENIVTHI